MAARKKEQKPARAEDPQPAQDGPPEIVWPQEGGTYLRDPDTGALTRLEDGE